MTVKHVNTLINNIKTQDCDRISIWEITYLWKERQPDLGYFVIKSAEMKTDKSLAFNSEGYFGRYCFIFDTGIFFVMFYHLAWLTVSHKYETADCIS